MNKYNYFVGIDISKKKLDICILEGKQIIEERCIDNTSRSLVAFSKWLEKMNIQAQNTLFCCEHTGIYASSLINWSTEHSYKLWLEKPIQIKRSIGLQRGKHDKIDAYRIGMYAFRYQDNAVIFKRPSKAIEELKHLLTLRQRLIKIKKQLEVPLKEIQTTLDKPCKMITDCSKQTLQGVKKDIIRVDTIELLHNCKRLAN